MMDDAVRAQERVCRPIGAAHEQDTTGNDAGPQIGPEGTMESLAGLRAYVGHHALMDEMTKAALLVYADNIEREVRERCVLLPLDADGVPIHIGDVMENIVCPPVHREVSGVGVECFYGWDEGNGRYSQFDVARYRHHHAPTVEDVLTEFGIDWEHESDCEDRAALLKEYAAKLRLAGDE